MVSAKSNGIRRNSGNPGNGSRNINVPNFISNQLQLSDPGYMDFSNNDDRYYTNLFPQGNRRVNYNNIGNRTTENSSYWGNGIQPPRGGRTFPPSPYRGNSMMARVPNRPAPQKTLPHPIRPPQHIRNFGPGSNRLPPQPIRGHLPPPPLLPTRNFPLPIDPIPRFRNNRHRNKNKKKNTIMNHNDGIGKKILNNIGGIKKLKHLQNTYPLNKPWVTDAIKLQFKKKEELENKLKGHRDDVLFAEFKRIRDEFVKLYEDAQMEYDRKDSKQDNNETKSHKMDNDKKMNEETESPANVDGVNQKIENFINNNSASTNVNKTNAN